MNNTFIGIGKNPEGPDLPLGLGMQLAQHPRATETFGKMSVAQKTELIHYIQGALTGDEAKHRIIESVAKLNDGQSLF